MMLAAFWTNFAAVLLIIVSIILIGLILLQKNRGAGLSGAFGGVGGHSAFGTKTGDFLTWVTVGLTALFLVLAVLLNFGFAPTKAAPTVVSGAPGGSGESSGPAESQGGVMPVAPPTPAGPSATPIPITATPVPITATPAGPIPAPAPTPPAPAGTTPPPTNVPPAPTNPAPTNPPAQPTNPPPAPTGTIPPPTNPSPAPATNPPPAPTGNTPPSGG